MPVFDPSCPADGGKGIWGLPYSEDESAMVLIPVPWEATVSYGHGASKGPSAMLAASRQIDVFDPEVERPYEPGIFMRPESPEVRAWARQAKAAAAKVVKNGGVGGRKELRKAAEMVDALSAKLNAWVRAQCLGLMRGGKIAGVVGGDHSVPYGAYQAAAETYGSYGLLHFDAHPDTRKAFEGFEWSHGSTMYNALERIPGIERLVQVGIRDYCSQEHAYLRSLGSRARVFFDHDLGYRRLSGEPFAKAAQEIVDSLPRKVWVSFDIDALDTKLCPHTGTPVPGGLDFSEALLILSVLGRSGRTILGFDLVEVASSPDKRDEWDANVGMRVLYKLAAWTFVSRGLRKPLAA
jgi:agmatinase